MSRYAGVTVYVPGNQYVNAASDAVPVLIDVVCTVSAVPCEAEDGELATM